ncbi:beta/alpha barrel domain-containing protein [Belnapia rosea]|uniref:hypothetical protein n=1 Tax=Belnapia rosea TaxID=938405 RepID=UPI0008819EF6|nr:hypothetical protein [Belnapia rosea]SDB70002.1 hydroxymethylglutaryl-CoA lyase [Belnapia rosea]
MSDLPSDAELEEITGSAAPAQAEVALGECLLSEALLAEAPVPAEVKLALIEAISGAGFHRIGITNLLDPEQDAQFADAEVVLRGATRRPGLILQAQCPDLLAVRRALVAQDGGWGPDEVVFSITATEADESWLHLTEMVALARGQFTLCGIVGAAFDEVTEPAAVLAAAERLAELGITRIAIADGSGVATPPRVRDLIGWLHGGLPTASFAARFADRRGTAIANTLAAIEAGLTQADTALGGAGGFCATEDLATALKAMGLGTGLDPAALRRAGRAAEQALGRPLHSRVLRLDEAASPA